MLLPVPLVFHPAVPVLLAVSLTAVCQLPGPILEVMDSLLLPTLLKGPELLHLGPGSAVVASAVLGVLFSEVTDTETSKLACNLC